MLVGTFQIQVGRVRQLLGMGAAQHVEVRGARVEPDVQRVLHLVKAGGVLAQQFGRIEFEPGVDALLFHLASHGFQ